MKETKTKRPKTKSQKVALVSLIIFAVLLIISFLPVPYESMGISTVPIAIIFLVSLFVLYVSLFGLIADMAAKKGRSWQAFFWLSLLVTPIVMLIIAASVSPLPGSAAYVAPVPTPSNPGSPDIAQEIEKLGSLKEQGLITKAEFEAKKKELLDRI